MPAKKFNRNPFNEKLIHRFFFETLYCDKQNRDLLVPSNIKQDLKKLNLVVPEASIVEGGYRPDFKLYFKGMEKTVAVEIKWHSKDLKENQKEALIGDTDTNGNRGYVLSFDDEDIEVEHVQIDKELFENWLIKRVKSLWNDAYSYKIEKQIGKRTWIVILRGKSIQNFQKMVKQHRDNFWAFQNTPFIMKNLLEIKHRDEIIFLLVKASGNERQALQRDSREKLDVLSFFVGNIKEPYVMYLKGPKATFFEGRDDLSVNNRKWPHFIEFTEEAYMKFEQNACINRNNFSKSLRKKIADSCNKKGKGIPILLDDIEANELKSELRLECNRLNKVVAI